jgi:hypothetical protein
MRVIALHRRFVEVQLLNTFESPCTPRTNFAFHLNHSSWTINRRQFPLWLTYATTFNGRQGLTLARTVLESSTYEEIPLLTINCIQHYREREREEPRCAYFQKRTNANIIFPDLLL